MFVFCTFESMLEKFFFYCRVDLCYFFSFLCIYICIMFFSSSLLLLLLVFWTDSVRVLACVMHEFGVFFVFSARSFSPSLSFSISSFAVAAAGWCCYCHCLPPLFFHFTPVSLYFFQCILAHTSQPNHTTKMDAFNTYVIWV